MGVNMVRREGWEVQWREGGWGGAVQCSAVQWREGWGLQRGEGKRGKE